MKLVCQEAPENYVIVIDAWSRALVKKYYEAAYRDMAEQRQAQENNESLAPEQAFQHVKDYMRSVVREIHFVDVSGRVFDDLEQWFEVDFDEIEFDAAVEGFWTSLPNIAYDQRRQLGKKTSVS